VSGTRRRIDFAGVNRLPVRYSHALSYRIYTIPHEYFTARANPDRTCTTDRASDRRGGEVAAKIAARRAYPHNRQDQLQVNFRKHPATD